MKSRLIFAVDKWLIIIFVLALVVQYFHGRVSANSTNALAFTVNTKMYQLDPFGGSLGIQCQVDPPDTHFGCTAIANDNNHAYPYSSNPHNVIIENDYLLDVISQEMSPEVYPQPVALSAQFIAARSYVNYYINNPPADFNNSTQFQAFIPYRFENLSPITFPDNSIEPCGSTNLNGNQRYVCNAAASKSYIAQAVNNPNNLAAKALFTADRVSQSLDGTFDKPYLKSVPDPISTTCDSNNEGPGYGFSQEGAVRWARGNQCAIDNPFENDIIDHSNLHRQVIKTM